MFYTVCLRQDSYCYTKHHDQKQVVEEWVYSAYTSTPLSITKGSQDRNSNRTGTWRQELMQRLWRVLLTWLLLACAGCFLLETRTSSSGVAPLTMDGALPQGSFFEKMPYSWISWRHSTEAPSSLRTLMCIKLTHQTSKHNRHLVNTQTHHN